MKFPPATEGQSPQASDQAPQAPGAAQSPRLVIRGESSETTGNVFGAFTDYLNVTFRLPDWKDPASGFFYRFSEVVGPAFGIMESLGRGLHGYTDSYRFERGQVRYAFGGQAGTALLTIPGERCAMVPDWTRLIGFLRDDLQGRITRWDGAVDDFNGVHPVNEAVDLYLAGAFNAGGRKPSCAQAGNWITEDEAGRTFYVGKRRNGKVLRVYEKGKQLGFGSSPWTRWEVELHNIDRVIPWEVITDPAPTHRRGVSRAPLGERACIPYPDLAALGFDLLQANHLLRSRRVRAAHRHDDESGGLRQSDGCSDAASSWRTGAARADGILRHTGEAWRRDLTRQRFWKRGRRIGRSVSCCI